ncbi:MAG TPA: decaprenyl-phosphate phosphoribosyltransferase [Candidatus Krumholzibacteria bacterium]|nr:decaprenyl-phosphate phosphoribosyltransferase [Candidatus Krumholzibacteria bacterium]
MKQLYHILISMRPRQWTKNLVVFAGLIFSRNFHDFAMVTRSVEAFAILCLLSGVIYIVNDIADVEKDRLHPVKRNRPLAAGTFRRSSAIAASLGGTALGLALSWRIGGNFFAVACGFFALNFVYSFFLKRVVLLDAMSISISFVLRAIAGVEALHDLGPHVEISPWLLICTLFLSLFLAFCKRRHELLSMENPGEHRETLDEYSPALLDQLVSITAGGSVLAYALYTIWPETVDKFGTTNLVYTVPLVLIGVMRYLYLVYNKQKGGSPSDLLLHERFLLVDVLAWIVLVIAILGGF